ncbi:variable lymphocyte receptor C, partial [Paramuricea clavata]
MNFVHFGIVLGILCTKYTKAACPNGCTCERQNLDYGEFVSCTGTNIVSFPKDISRSKQTILLSNTNVDTIPKDAFTNLPNLIRIFINQNKKLRTLPSGIFNHTVLKKLEVVNLNRNSLTRVPDHLFNNLPKLRQVYINGNDLLEFPSNTLRNLPSLSQLHLEKNNLTSLPENLFDDSMTQVVYASFADNQLSSLPNNIFKPIKNSLQSLYIEKNQFKFLPMNALRITGKQFIEVTVHSNPTFCNCSLAEFAIWAEGKILSQGVTCNGVNTALNKINLTHCEISTTTINIPTTKTEPSTTKLPSTTKTPTEEITTTTQEPSTTTVPSNSEVTNQPSTTGLPLSTKQPTLIVSTREETTESSTQAATTTPAPETSPTPKIATKIEATKPSVELTTKLPGVGDTESQDTSDENRKRKTIIIAVSVTAVTSVVILSLILCLFHTGILSTRRFRKDKVVIYDAE